MIYVVHDYLKFNQVCIGFTWIKGLKISSSLINYRLPSYSVKKQTLSKN